MKLLTRIEGEKGQSIFEILIAISIATLIVGSAATAIIVSMKSGAGSANSQRAYGIANEMLNNVRSFAESNWADLYNHGTSTYYLTVTATSSTSTTLGLTTGTSTVTVGDVDYGSSFTIEDVNRNISNWVGDGYEDPTTLKITAYVEWSSGGATSTIDLSTYISKIRSRTISFIDWSGSSGVSSAVTGPTSDYYAIGGNATITGAGDISY